MADSSSNQMKYKIVFLGDQGVGKSSLILRFTQDTFDVKYMVSNYTFADCVIHDHKGDDRNRLPYQDSERG